MMLLESDKIIVTSTSHFPPTLAMNYFVDLATFIAKLSEKMSLLLSCFEYSPVRTPGFKSRIRPPYP